MTKLVTATPINVSAGTYNLKVVDGSGGGQLQYSVNNEAMQDIPDATATNTLELPSCRVNAVLTGTAEMYLNLIRR